MGMGYNLPCNQWVPSYIFNENIFVVDIIGA